MNKQIIIAVSLLFPPLFFIACGSGKLSQSEAKKQIEQLFNDRDENPNIYFNIYGGAFQENNVPSDKVAILNKLKNAGYIDYKFVRWVNVYTNSAYNTATIVTLYPKSKINPYLKDKLEYFNRENFNTNGVDNLIGISVKGGTYTYTAKVISITEAAANSEGKIVSNVTYTKHISAEENELGKLCDLQLTKTDTGTTPEFNVNFVKTQDGWKLEKR